MPRTARPIEGIYEAGAHWIARRDARAPDGYVLVRSAPVKPTSGFRALTHQARAASVGALARAVAQGQALTRCGRVVRPEWEMWPRDRVAEDGHLAPEPTTCAACLAAVHCGDRP